MTRRIPCTDANFRRRERRSAAWLRALLAGLLFACGGPVAADALAAPTTVIGCDQAGSLIQLTASGDYALDPSCTYTAGIEISASDVDLDCRHAVLDDVEGNDGRGIHVTAPIDVALKNVRVHGCDIRHFLNNVRISREGFKTLAEGHEYDVQYENVVIENSRLTDSRGSGLFVNGYVTGVTLRNLDISGSGSVGVYLEAGSKGTLVERNRVHDNGYGDVTPEGIPFVVGGVEIRYLSTGREGIAIDGSRDNVVRRNVIERNSYGGIFLYKNCGENFTSQPGQWWTRRYGADGNVIEKNRISDEYTGVWIGSRMAENTLFMDCSDAPYSTGPFASIRLDYAKQNRVERNVFTDVDYGIRVEDDGNAILSNRFRGSDATDQAILVGTLYRTSVLAQPVTGTTISGNASQIRGNASPFGWIHGHDATTFERNRARGRLATLAPGVQPTINFHLFVKQILPAP
ncbi:MAG: right-handed parallel beta-helix repeat-containing protein [Candidatus Binatia bacterium]